MQQYTPFLNGPILDNLQEGWRVRRSRFKETVISTTKNKNVDALPKVWGLISVKVRLDEGPDHRVGRRGDAARPPCQ